MNKDKFMHKYVELINTTEVQIITVIVMTPGLAAPESISNPRENFYAKLDYYNRAYNDDMRLINNEDVYILDVKGA